MNTDEHGTCSNVLLRDLNSKQQTYLVSNISAQLAVSLPSVASIDSHTASATCSPAGRHESKRLSAWRSAGTECGDCLDEQSLKHIENTYIRLKVS